MRLFQQNESILGYWHSQFHHILVDEYQDTNRIQYELIRLLSTNGETNQAALGWHNRSLFVVGDADQSIYSFRMADFTILLEFQENFGDRLPMTKPRRWLSWRKITAPGKYSESRQCLDRAK